MTRGWHPVELAILEAAVKTPGKVNSRMIGARFEMNTREVGKRATLLRNVGHLVPRKRYFFATPAGRAMWERLQK